VVGDSFNSADPLIGRKLDGRYEVLERLGEGGAGVVYRGRQTHLGRFVAIKVLHQDTASSEEWRRRFQREAIALSVLAHPNVVPVTDFGVDNGVPFLVMELLEGQTLGALIKEGPLPLWRALEIARQTLRVLAFSHIKGVVHGDLKPTNVFLQALPDQADHVRLLDFGMAKFVEDSSSRAPAELTRGRVMIGTPAYMSPEQVKGAPTDETTDVYAAGLLLFELLAGRRPFVADCAEGYLAMHLTAPTPSLAQFRRGLARASLFQAVVEQAMAKKPAERFKDAYAMAVALEDVVARLPAAVVSGGRAEARRKPTPRARSAAPSGSRFWPRVMLLVILAVGIAAVEEYLRHEGTKQAKTTAVPAAQPAEPALSLPTPPKPALPAAPARTATQPLPAPTPPAPSLPSPEPEPPTSPEPEPPTSPVVKVQAPTAPEAPERPAQLPSDAKAAQGPRDPWREPVPRPLRPIRDRVKRGVHLSQRALVPVYEFARKNPDDPRPWLLLGAAYAQVDWYRDSVERYLRAYQVDSSCRADPQMLADLLKAAAHPVAGRSAARAIRDIYGVEAIPALEQALEHDRGDRDATARLTRLRESLPH
jgi:predicted Ser/Thr protein kinase